ncbi:Copper resistance D [Bradyrhizobium sp. STM 3843]|nr:Copper resistance D [Bradyrhizobium sp. STM 3843]
MKAQAAMSWFGVEIAGPLVAARATHFAASAIVAGVMIFRSAVLAPSLRSTPRATIDRQLRIGVWLGLAAAIVSGLVWLVLEAASMSGLSVDEATTPETLSTVLTATQFGSVMQLRSICVVVLAASLVQERTALLRWLGLAAALGLVGAIAWTGHAGSTAGNAGILHLAADVLHLWAASAWSGGLLALVLLLAAPRQLSGEATLQTMVVRRFSTLGIIAVGILIVSGVIQTWLLVGSIQAMAVTAYGRLLTVKIVVFTAMLLLAAINRIWLTPHLATAAAERATAMLRRTAAAELMLALVVFVLVGALGTLHPAAHFMI